MTAELFLPDVPVLMLHRVLQEHEPDNYYFRRGTAISWTRFESLVVWAEAQRAKGFPTPVFTFDDGYSDNQAAFRVLLNKQLPVILFPVRDFIQTGFSIIDDMAARLNGPDCALSPRITRSLLSGKLKRCLSALSPAEYRYYRARWFGIMDDADAAPFLTENELVVWAGRGLQLGVHGLSHRVWTDLSPQELQQEVSGSVQWLSCLGYFKPSAICMPHGKINSRVYQVLETYGLPLIGVDHKYKHAVIRRSWVKEKQE